MASSLRVNSIIPSSGTNVAIGTAGGTVTYTATVSGVSTFSSGIVVSAGSTSVPSISPSGDSNTGIFFPSADTVAIGEGGVEVLRVDSNGRVGINTINPKSTLDVGGVISIGRIDSSVEGGEITFCKSSNNSSAWSIDVYGSTSTPNLRFVDNTAALTRMEIDGSGRVVKPYQPAFWITNFSWSTSTQRPHNASNVWSNVGSHFNNSNGIFTAPAAGYYLFICTVQGHNPGETSGRNTTFYNLVATKNGSDLGNEIVGTCQESTSGKHDQITHQAIINLAINDTFYFRSNYGYRVVQNSYVGYLLG